MQKYGVKYTRLGPPSYRIQVQSFKGSYLSTAMHTSDRTRVGRLAKELAEQAQNFLAEDGILRIVDTNTSSVDGYMPLSTYLWKDGCWIYSHGSRISDLDA